LIGQKIGGEGEPTPRQHHHQPVVAERTDEAIEGHGRDVIEHGAPLQTEASVRGQQGIPGHLRSHLTVPQDEVWQDGEYGVTCGALDTPDGEATKANPRIMGVPCETPATATGRLVCELKAYREEEGEDELNKRLGVAQEGKVGRLIVEVDG